MGLITRIKDTFHRYNPPNPSTDEVEIVIYGLHTKLVRKMSIPVPHEVSIYVPRLEFTTKITEGGQTTETNVVLNSLTIVSAPMRESTKPLPKLHISPGR